MNGAKKMVVTEMYQPLADRTLLRMKKKEIIGLMRTAEHNAEVSQECVEQQAESLKDLQPVRRGRWKKDEYGWAQCPFCNKIYDVFDMNIVKAPLEWENVWKTWDKIYRFCPSCGAHLGA